MIPFAPILRATSAAFSSALLCSPLFILVSPRELEK
jgi:hypothetical protein